MILIHGSVTGHSGMWFSNRTSGRMVHGNDTRFSNRTFIGIWFSSRTSGCMVHDNDIGFSNRTLRYMVQ